ncbi:hypothetical protein QN224_31420 [Sinorhizobium sp. 8-89]|uniref:hypothetical protein n=1 Tax=Sinorhizobium sp. 7-81 TaxID=3049087 RepID=UPI0024C354CA|nr:hypothetical protein [Sinorhizobium sp. 7-81]MDK1389848.1 hypothetical protein [Sinorhizobium sp. 7-81]
MDLADLKTLFCTRSNNRDSGNTPKIRGEHGGILQRNVILKLAIGSVQQAVNDQNTGWRNEVVRAVGMDSNTFQMARGTLGLQSADSSVLFLSGFGFAIIDHPSISIHRAERSSACHQMLHTMLPSTSSGLRAALGDQYSSWIAYRNADTSAG